ncbi:MAG TPA: disulfide bond formation protein B [Ilumatobacteraceae bacterium]|nr:disulfide bond formation protein B [Ilumatobacteraceae bacterium]
MSYDAISTLHDVEAALAIVALIGAVVMVVARLTPTVIGVRFLDALYKVQLPLAALVAVTATAGSLYFSEFNEQWTPCRWCWFQRIFMYSLAVVLTVAAIRRDRNVKWFAAPLAAIGICCSFWHILIEHRVVEESKACLSVQSCAAPWRVSFGTLGYNDDGVFGWSGLPVTLAVMAFCGFAAILALLLTPEPLDTDPLDTELPEVEQDGQSSAS